LIRASLKGDKIEVEADTKDVGLNSESAMAKEFGRNRVYAYGTSASADFMKNMSRGPALSTYTL